MTVLVPKRKVKRVEDSMKLIAKRFGAGAVSWLSGDGEFDSPEAFSSGSLGLDIATRIGGIPRGRITEYFGHESSGKSTLALHSIAAAIRAGELSHYIDAEHSLDKEYAKLLGVLPEWVTVHQPDNGEQGFEIAETLISQEAVGLVVIDSIAEMRPRADMESHMGDVSMGGRARLVSDAMGKLKNVVKRSNTALLVLNQLRDRMGGMPGMFAPTTTTPCGRELKHISSLRVEVTRIKQIKAGERVVGAKTKFRLAKSKVSAPYQAGEFDLIYYEGISREAEILDLGVQAKVLEKTGTRYYWHGERLEGDGRENARRALKENPAQARQIEDEVRAVLTKLPTEAEAGAVEQEEQ